MSDSVSRSFLRAERFLVVRPARVPNTFRRVSGVGSQPAIFVTTARFFAPSRDSLVRATAHMRLADVNVQAQATVPGSAVLISATATANGPRGSYDNLARPPSKR